MTSSPCGRTSWTGTPKVIWLILRRSSPTRGFNKKACALKREFFKHVGHFSDEYFKAYVQHVLGKTLNPKLPYPKLSVQKTKKMIIDNFCGSDWVERRKRKKVIIEELMAIKPSLKFQNADLNVNHETWQLWKNDHLFTTATWDFLLTALKADYFRSGFRMRGS